VLLWGLGKLKHGQVAQAEFELRERQHERDRMQVRGSAEPPAR
jgi:hypothetical protein